MGNFIAWLLGVPAGTLVVAYALICASLLSAKRRRAAHDLGRSRVPIGIAGFQARTRNPVGHSVSWRGG